MLARSGRVNTSLMARAASNVFGSNVIALLAQIDTLNGPMVFKNITGRGLNNDTPQHLDESTATYGTEVTATETVSPFALFCATAIVGLYGVSVLLLFFNLAHRRTPKEPNIVVNVLSMIYDSSLMKLAEQSWTADRFKSLQNVQFDLGLFVGRSGKQRLRTRWFG